TLTLAKSSGNAFGGDLVIGDGSGSDLVTLGASNQIPDSAAVTLSTSGTLDLAGFSDAIGTLTMTGGAVTTGAGTLTLGGDVTVTASANGSTLSGKLDLGAATRTFTIANGAAATDLDLAAAVSGAVGLIKAGPGVLALSGSAANTFSGTTT